MLGDVALLRSAGTKQCRDPSSVGTLVPMVVRSSTWVKSSIGPECLCLCLCMCSCYTYAYTHANPHSFYTYAYTYAYTSPLPIASHHTAPHCITKVTATLSGEGLSKAEAGTGTRFHIDLAGCHSEAAAVAVTLVEPSGKQRKLRVGKNGDVLYTPKVAGRHKLEVTIGGDSVEGSPFMLEVESAHADARLCEVHGHAVEAFAPLDGFVEPGAGTDVTVTVKDSHGNPCEGKVEVLVGDTKAVVIDDGDGLYEATFDAPATKGHVRVSVRVDGKDIGGSPFELNIGHEVCIHCRYC